MGRTLDNKKIMEHRKEFTSMPHSKPKRIRRAATPQDVVNGETIVFQYNLAGLAGLSLLWIAPSMTIVPTPVKKLALDNNIRVLQYEKIRKEDISDE
jgi:hypothetical protein